MSVVAALFARLRQPAAALSINARCALCLPLVNTSLSGKLFF